MRNLLYPPGISRRFINRGLILMGSLCFLFFMSLKPLYDREIIEFSQERFNINMPGFQAVLDSPNVGKWFELETALCIHDFYNEKVLGFNLDINITDTLNNRVVEVLIPGYKVELRSTEYDIVTNEHVFECKSGKIISKRIKMSQFFKERNLIEWFKVVKREALEGSLTYKIEFSKKGNPVLVINGISTMGKDIRLVSSWIDCWSSNDFYDHWSEIIELLSTKELILVFKRRSSGYVRALLQRNNFVLEDYFSYKRCLNRMN